LRRGEKFTVVGLNFARTVQSCSAWLATFNKPCLVQLKRVKKNRLNGLFKQKN